VDERHVLDRIEDALEGILDGQDEAGRELAHVGSGVHQGGAVGQKLPTQQRRGEGVGVTPDVACERGLGLRHRIRDAPAQPLEVLEELPARVAPQIALLENPLGVGRRGSHMNSLAPTRHSE
jgi:hypothetical protein